MPERTDVAAPNHDGTPRRPADRFFCNPSPAIGPVVSATTTTSRLMALPLVGALFARLLPIAEAATFVGTEGFVSYRRQGRAVHTTTLVEYCSIDDVELSEVNMSSGIVVHRFDFRGRFGTVRITGEVDEKGLSPTENDYHFAMAALRSYRRWAESRPIRTAV